VQIYLPKQILARKLSHPYQPEGGPGEAGDRLRRHLPSRVRRSLARPLIPTAALSQEMFAGPGLAYGPVKPPQLGRARPASAGRGGAACPAGGATLGVPGQEAVAVAPCKGGARNAGSRAAPGGRDGARGG